MSTKNDQAKINVQSSIESAALTSRGPVRTDASPRTDGSKESLRKTKGAEDGTAQSKVAVEDRMSEFDERFENVDDQLKQLFEKTNFQNQKYFKYMNEKMEEQDGIQKKHVEKFAKLQEFFTLCETHENPSLVKALELELAAFVKRTIEYEAGKLIKQKTKEYLQVKDFKDTFGPFEEKFHEGNERQMETNQLTDQRFAQLQHGIETVKENAVNQQDRLLEVIKKGEEALKYTLNQKFSLAATQISLERLEFSSQESFEKLNGLLEREYYESGIIEAKLSKLQELCKNTYVSRSSQNQWQTEYDQQDKAHSTLLARHIESIEANKDSIENLYELTKAKALRSELEKLRQGLLRYCLYDDLKELHNKVVPSIDMFQGQMAQFRVEHERTKEMLRNFDEVIALKANKGDFFELRETKLEKAGLDEAEQALSSRIDGSDVEIGNLKEFIHNLQETMQTQIYEGVKKANATIIKAQEKLAERKSKMAMEEQLELDRKAAAANKALSKNKASKRTLGASPSRYKTTNKSVTRPVANNDDLLMQKADIKDLLALGEIKSNKFDTNFLMKCVDIQHKQITHIVVLLVEAVKTMLSQSKETMTSKQNKRMYILQQGMSVLNWVSNFDPESVNVRDLTLPNELRTMSKYTKQLLGDFTKNEELRHRRGSQTSVGFYDKPAESASFAQLDQNASTSNMGDYVRLDSISQFRSPQHADSKSPFAASRLMFNQTEQSGPPLNSTTHQYGSKTRKYVADLGSPGSGVTTGMQTGDETQFAFTKLDTNYDTKQKVVLDGSKRAPKSLLSPTFAGRVGSVTHLGEEHGVPESKGKYFKTARGTVPNIAVMFEDKKTKTKQNMFSDSTDAGTGQFGDLLATVPARASGSRNINADPRKSQPGKDKDKTWNAVVLPSINEGVRIIKPNQHSTVDKKPTLNLQQ